MPFSKKNIAKLNLGLSFWLDVRNHTQEGKVETLVPWNAIGSAVQGMDTASMELKKRVEYLKKAQKKCDLTPLYFLAWSCSHLEALDAFAELNINLDFQKNYNTKSFVSMGIAHASPILTAIDQNQTAALKWGFEHGLKIDQAYLDPKVKEYHQTKKPSFLDRYTIDQPLSLLSWSFSVGAFESAEYLWDRQEIQSQQNLLDEALLGLMHRLLKNIVKEVETITIWMEKLLDAGADPHVKSPIILAQHSEFFKGSYEGLGDLLNLEDNDLEYVHRFNEKYINKKGPRRIEYSTTTASAAELLWDYGHLFSPCGNHGKSLLAFQKASQGMLQKIDHENFENLAVNVIQNWFCNAPREGVHHSGVVVEFPEWLTDPLLWTKFANPQWLTLQNEKEPFCVWLDLVGIESEVKILSLRYPQYKNFAQKLSDITQTVWSHLELSDEMKAATLKRACQNFTENLKFNPLELGALSCLYQELNPVVQQELEEWAAQRQIWQQTPPSTQQEKDLVVLHANQLVGLFGKGRQEINRSLPRRRL